MTVHYTGSKVLAGSSAKKESTRIAAIERALFTEESHVRMPKKYWGGTALIDFDIGDTGDGRTDPEGIGLPEIERFFSIQEVSNREDIQRASKKERVREACYPGPGHGGKEVFLCISWSSRIFERARLKNEIQEIFIRPTFSYLGRYTIADTVVKSVVHYIASGVEASIGWGGSTLFPMRMV